MDHAFNIEHDFHLTSVISHFYNCLLLTKVSHLKTKQYEITCKLNTRYERSIFLICQHKYRSRKWYAYSATYKTP